jgi:hypothetical protein
MGGLNVHADDQNSPSASQKKKWNKSPKLIIGLAVLIAIPIIGTTFAGTITVTPSTVTFGQGQAAAMACDPSVVITPNANYSGGHWYLTNVIISGLDTSACAGKNVTVAAYDTSGNTISGSATTFVPVTFSTATDITGTATTSTWITDGSNSITEDSATQVSIVFGEVKIADHDIQGFTIQQN